MRSRDLALLVMLAACAPRARLDPAPGGAPSPRSDIEGESAPALDAKSIDGAPVRLSALRGKVVIVDFWATWCGPCRRSLPVLRALRQRHRWRGLEVVGIAEDDDERVVAPFVQRHDVEYPVVWDHGKSIAFAWQATATPSLFVVGRDGTVRFARVGYDDALEAALESEVTRLLGESADDPRSR